MKVPITYGEAFADVYDEWYNHSDDLAAVVALSCEHHPLRVLELGVGTGRVALALAGVVVPAGGEVVGIDESPEMLALLAAKDTQKIVTTICGDMVDNQPTGPFDLIFCSYNTLFNVSDTQRQLTCLKNAAQRLSPTGRLILDACILDPAAPINGTVSERRGSWMVTTTSTFDVERGIVDGRTVSAHDDGRSVERPWRIAYQSPALLEAACAQAGLQLSAHYSSWHKTPFDDDAQRHVSVYCNLR